MSPGPIVYTPEELAKIFKIPVSRIVKLAKNGELKGKKLGAFWRFLKADVEKYLEKARKESPWYSRGASVKETKKSLPILFPSKVDQMEGQVRKAKRASLRAWQAFEVFKEKAIKENNQSGSFLKKMYWASGYSETFKKVATEFRNYLEINKINRKRLRFSTQMLLWYIDYNLDTINGMRPEIDPENWTPEGRRHGK